MGQRGASNAMRPKTLFFGYFSRNKPNQTIVSIPPWTIVSDYAILNVRGVLDTNGRSQNGNRKWRKNAKWDISHSPAKSLVFWRHVSRSPIADGYLRALEALGTPTSQSQHDVKMRYISFLSGPERVKRDNTGLVIQYRYLNDLS